jgi:group II intron reverse transcriptase/maturase
MREAETILNIVRVRGQRGLPLQDAYRLLFQRDLYLRAYGKLYANQGAMTPGPTAETVDGMSLAKIDAIIDLLRRERFRWTPVRRTYIPKKNGKLRPLGLPSWTDKLLQEVLRLILEAYFEPQFSDRSHGFRPGRGCHTALQEIRRVGKGTKWFIEGDISACFDRIDHSVLMEILAAKIPDQRFLRLIQNLLDAGYLEDWKWNATYSGVPQGGVISPVLSNLVLDRLDRFVEQELLPTHSRGLRRKSNTPYVALTVAASRAKKKGDRERARLLMQQAQAIPSRNPQDSDFRRLWYVRYADDFLLGYIGPKSEAVEIKQRIAEFLGNRLKLQLSDEKTLIAHALDERAKFLGYELHVLHADSKHTAGRRSINGSIGLRVPAAVTEKHSAKYLLHGRPIHLPERLNDSAFSIVALYQAEFRGLVEYYRLAYNLHTLSRVKWVAEQSLVKTLANKLKASCSDIYRRFQRALSTLNGTYKVLAVVVERGPEKKPLMAYFGGIPLSRDDDAAISDLPPMIWTSRSELVQRLLAQKCELCGSEDDVEVHHLRKLADLKGRSRWEKVMAARRRKTLVVCRACHDRIHAGTYDGPALRPHITGEPDAMKVARPVRRGVVGKVPRKG